MGAEVEDCVCLEYLLEVGVVRREAVVETGRLGEEQSHLIVFVPEGGMDADEDVPELLAVDDEVLPVGVEVAGRRSPILLQVLRVRGELVVLVGAHAVGDVQLGGVDARLAR